MNPPMIQSFSAVTPELIYLLICSQSRMSYSEDIQCRLENMFEIGKLLLFSPYRQKKIPYILRCTLYISHSTTHCNACTCTSIHVILLLSVGLSLHAQCQVANTCARVTIVKPLCTVHLAVLACIHSRVTMINLYMCVWEYVIPQISKRYMYKKI